MAFRVIAALILFVIAAPAAYAQDGAPARTPDNAPVAIGTVMEAEGTLTITRGANEPLNTKVNDPIYMNDIITTAPGGRAFILLIDDTELTLGEDARLTVDEYVFDEENPVANKGVYSIIQGSFLYTSGLLAKTENPNVTVNTPFASIGIRGTTFWGGMIDEEYGVLVQEGKVTVQTDRGRINVDQNQGTFIRSKTSIPSRANTWGQAKTDMAVNSIALKNASAVRERVIARAEMQKQDRARYQEFRKNHVRPAPGRHDGPLKRIENAPRMQDKPMQQNEMKPDGKNPNGVKMPQKPVPQKIDEKKSDNLLQKDPTRTEGTAPAPLPMKAGVEEVPVKGENEAHTNELREQQHLRKQPVIRQNQNRLPQQQRAPRPSKADGAF